MKPAGVATFQEEEPARQLCERLHQAGIGALVRNESKRDRFWFVSRPLAAIHVEVKQADFESARHLLQQWDGDEVLRRVVRCPSCSSTRIEYPHVTRKFLLPVASAYLMALGILRRKFYCFDCQYTWSRHPAQEPARDALGWPVESRLWHPDQPEKEK